MGEKTEALAQELEARAAAATAVLEKLSEADWKKVTEAEQWTVGVTAHHVAVNHEALAAMVSRLATGEPMPHLTMEMLHEANARHAREHAGCTKEETIALHRKGAAAAAAVVRGLSDDQLAVSGTLLAGGPAMTVEQAIRRILIRHIDDHFGSIKKTVGL